MSKNALNSPVPIAPKVLIFDMDDTVLLCQEAYRLSRVSFAAFIQSRCPGLSEEEIIDIFKNHDHHALTNHLFGENAYPDSMVSCFEAIAKDHKLAPTEAELKEVHDIGQNVYNFDYAPYPGAIEMLEAYKKAGVALGLCTRGDPTRQLPKIAKWGLAHIFTRIDVVNQKTPELFLDMVKSLDPTALPSASNPVPKAWVIGDSLRHDVGPALAASLGAIQVHPETTAHHDTGLDVRAHYTLDNVAELVTVLPVPRLIRQSARPNR